MMGHKICFSEEIWIIIPKLSLLLLLIWSPENKHEFSFPNSLCEKQFMNVHEWFMDCMIVHEQFVSWLIWHLNINMNQS